LHFNFLFVPCGAFYCTLNTHYRIVSYRTRVTTDRRTDGRKGGKMLLIA